MIKNKKGYTMAEIITVVVLLGVVATIVLIKFAFNHDKEFEAKYNKIAAIIEANIQQDMISTTGMTFADYQNYNERYRNVVTNNFEIKATAAPGDKINSFWSDTQNINGTNIGNGNFYFYKLSDETVIAIPQDGTDIFIDVNGIKGPNKIGKDIRKYGELYNDENQNNVEIADGGDNNNSEPTTQEESTTPKNPFEACGGTETCDIDGIKYTKLNIASTYNSFSWSCYDDNERVYKTCTSQITNSTLYYSTPIDSTIYTKNNDAKTCENSTYHLCSEAGDYWLAAKRY